MALIENKEMLKQALLAGSITAALTANAASYVSINAYGPTDLSTAGNWMIVDGSDDPNWSASNDYVSLVDKPRGWMNSPSRGEWVSTSKEAAKKGIPAGKAVYEVRMTTFKSQNYCMQGVYFADDRVTNIHFEGERTYLVNQVTPYPCANGKCNALKSAAIGQYFWIEFRVREGLPQFNNQLSHSLQFTVENDAGPSAFAADVFVKPGLCLTGSYENYDDVERLGLSEAVASGWNVPITGDWDCDGRDTIGWYLRDIGKFHLWNTSDMKGPPDHNFWFGPKKRNWVPIAGDWSGDGCDTVALYDPKSGRFLQKYSHSNGGPDDIIRTR